MVEPIRRRKLLVVGDGACGKTCLLMVYSKNEFPTDHIPNVCETYMSNVVLDGRLVELTLWDTAGQEEYDDLRRLSYPYTNVVLICFSVDSPDSLENIESKWYPEVLYYCPRLPIVLVCCKKDLRFDARTIQTLRENNQAPVTSMQGLEVATKIGAYRYVECSARTGEGV
ncbi:GTP-binding protein Rho1, partial [Cladochytrium tenue]